MVLSAGSTNRCGVEQWQLVGLITRRSQVQVLPPLLRKTTISSRSFFLRSARFAQATAPATKKDHDELMVFVFKVCTLRASQCPRYYVTIEDRQAILNRQARRFLIQRKTPKKEMFYEPAN